MKTLQLIRLGHKSIAAHKKRTFFTVVVIGSVFSVLAAAMFLLQGIENNLLQAGLSVTDGKVVTVVEICDGNYHANEPLRDGNGEILVENGEVVYSGEEMCSEPGVYDKIATSKSAKYNGNFLGALISYRDDNGNMLYVIPEKAAKYLDAEPVYDTPHGKIPTLESVDIASSDEFGLDKNIYYSLGTYPSTMMNVHVSSRPNSEQNLIDGFITVGNAKTQALIVHSGSAETENFIVGNGYKVFTYEPLISFDKFDDAYKFYKEEYCNKSDVDGKSCGQKFVISELFAGNISTRFSYELTYREFLTTMIVFLVVSSVIMIFSFMRIIDDETKTIALYRSLGATKTDIYKIYLFELFEFSILTILFVAVVGILIAMIVNGKYISVFETSISENFGIDFSATPMIGINLYHSVILLTILLIAPICSLTLLSKLSTKNIAKKLKEN